MWITINQRTTHNVTKWRNYRAKLSESVELKQQEEPWGSRLPFLTVRKKIGMDNFRIINEYSISILWQTCEKTNYGVLTLTDEPPSLPHMTQYSFSWTNPPSFSPSVRTSWMIPNVIRCSVLRLWVDYLIYFNLNLGSFPECI